MTSPAPPEAAAFDDRGWLVALALPLMPPDAAYSLFSPNAEGRFEEARWDHAARRFFGVTLTITPPKRYDDAGSPSADEAKLSVTALATGAALANVRVTTVPLSRAPGVLAAAERAAAQMGGAGFDVLLGRARRLWQIEAAAQASREARVAAVAIVAVLANVLLAPALPPEGGVLFGVKGARERLDALRGPR